MPDAKTIESSVPSKQPQGLPVLFFAELWERFSFYGMRSLLTLYMTKAQRFSESAAYGVYAAYGLLVYAFPVLGGLLADRVLGFRLAILWGGILMAAGHFVMAFPHRIALYVALALLCLGNGFFKPNISSLLGQLYQTNDPRRDAGFMIFYLGINVGAFAAPLLCGTVGEKVNWHWGFSMAGVGMVVGLLWFVVGRARLEGHGALPLTAAIGNQQSLSKRRLSYIAIGSLVTVVPTALAIWRNDLLAYVLYPLGVIVYGAIIIRAFRLEAGVRGRLFAALILMIGSMVFWALFEQAGSSLTLFADRHVDRAVVPVLFGLRDRFGAMLPASVLLAANPLYIMILAIPVSRLWTLLNHRNRDPSISLKFALGLIQVGLGYLVIVFIAIPGAHAGTTHIGWLLLMYLLHTTGELCLSPVGLSAMTKLAPTDMRGTVMGAWFLATAYSHHFGGLIAKQTTAGMLPSSETATAALAKYATVFGDIGWFAIAVGILFAASSRFITHLMRR